MVSILAQLSGPPFESFPVDWHGLAPEIVVLSVAVLITLVDSIGLERARPFMPGLAGLGLLGALVPIITLAVEGSDRVLFGGAYVVDDLSLLLKAVFLLSGYVIVLLSTNYIAEGDYWEGEYYNLLLFSLLGMVVMASARDLITIFVALELLSIPAYLLAAWRKGDRRSNEAGMKYLLMGVFASAVMLYGMSLVYGVTGTTLLEPIGVIFAEVGTASVITLGVIFVIIGFSFKVSAVPFHTWAPDTYEGAPTPVAAFLAVASKIAGFVALISLVYFGFLGQSELIEPLLFILATLSMFIGNLIALRQTNIIRMLAYSGVAQAGFMLAPFAVAASDPETSLKAVVIYLVIYAAMNLGAFAVVIALARKTRSGEISSFGGAFQYAPALTVAMSVFLFSLAGIPPLGGWFAKFSVFAAVVNADTTAGYVMAVIVAVNSVIALYYYAQVAKTMWMDPVPDGDMTPVSVPPSLRWAIVMTAAFTLFFGVLPGVLGDVTDSFDLGHLELLALPG